MSSAVGRSQRDWINGIFLLAATFAVYANSLHAPFVFDDYRTIVGNPHIRHLLPFWEPMRQTTRPLTLLTLAVNYSIGGLNPWGYHLVNMLIHGLAGLVLYALIRRTLLLPKFSARKFEAQPLAFTCALLWLVHPLQTESVAYTIQRAESLMGLWYLLTVYCVLRGSIEGSSSRWYALSVLMCALGMASKPVMATAPVLVLAYDWVFIAKSWRELVRVRGRMYLGLMGTWLFLFVVCAGAPEDYAGTVGASVPGVSGLTYLTTQAGVIAHYIRLFVWPHPLILAYDWPIRADLFSVAQACFVFGSALLAFFLTVKRSVAGFLGTWFFGVLAPTSSFFALADPIFEHRMYLSLAALIVAAVMGSQALLARCRRKNGTADFVLRLGLVPAVLFGLTTAHRNREYAEVIPLWKNIIAYQPGNVRAHGNLGFSFETRGQWDEAVAEYLTVLALTPKEATAHHNLGTALAKLGRFKESESHFRQAVSLSPDYAQAHYQLGMVLLMEDKTDESIEHFLRALDLDPDNVPLMLENIRQVSAGQGKQDQIIARLKVWVASHQQESP